VDARLVLDVAGRFQLEGGVLDVEVPDQAVLVKHQSALRVTRTKVSLANTVLQLAPLTDTISPGGVYGTPDQAFAP